MWQQMMWIAIGATAGAWLRWAIGNVLNRLPCSISCGTMAANWGGCLIAGAVLAWTWKQPLPDAVKACLVTGFLGSLTTFSAFASELADHIAAQKWTAAAAVFALHTAGGTLMALLGAAAAAKLLK